MQTKIFEYVLMLLKKSPTRAYYLEFETDSTKF